MAHKVETMAFANELPWHGLGVKVTSKLSPQQMAKAAKIDWTVSLREMFLKDGTQVPGAFALCRDTDDRCLSVVGSTYKPVQNEQALDFFTKFVKAGHMDMETAGSLWDGRYIWGLAKLSKDFKLGKEDEVKGYLLISAPHVRGHALVIQFTPIRVVCWNTLTFALGSNLKGKGNAFRMPHSMEFNDHVKDKAEQALGIAGQQMEEFQAAAALLSKKKAKKADVDDYFAEVLHFDPKKAEKKKDGEIKVPRILPYFQQALLQAPGHDLATAEGTWWGALNAVTYVVDHMNGRQRDTALKNAWFGNMATVKRRAFDLAIDKAK